MGEYKKMEDVTQFDRSVYVSIRSQAYLYYFDGGSWNYWLISSDYTKSAAWIMGGGATDCPSETDGYGYWHHDGSAWVSAPLNIECIGKNFKNKKW